MEPEPASARRARLDRCGEEVGLTTGRGRPGGAEPPAFLADLAQRLGPNESFQMRARNSVGLTGVLGSFVNTSPAGAMAYPSQCHTSMAHDGLNVGKWLSQDAYEWRGS